MTTKKFTQYVKCVFTDAEITDRARELAASNRKRTEVEQRKKEIDSDLKSKIEAENSKIARLSDQISTGHEYRDVECRVDLDLPVSGQKTIIRLDTGEEVGVQLMTDDDKQMALDLNAQAEATQMPVPESHRLEEGDGTAYGDGFTAMPPDNAGPVIEIDGGNVTVIGKRDK